MKSAKKYRLSLALVLAALAPAALGQTIFYRSTMPDGRTVLSDRPTPGAKKVEEIYVPPSSPGSPPAATPTAPVGRAVGSAAPPVQNRDANLDVAITGLRSAEAMLRVVEEAREAGQEPIENERTGMQGGGSRLNEAYFARQKLLADAVEQARARVDAAQAKVNSLR